MMPESNNKPKSECSEYATALKRIAEIRWGNLGVTQTEYLTSNFKNNRQNASRQLKGLRVVGKGSHNNWKNVLEVTKEEEAELDELFEKSHEKSHREKNFKDRRAEYLGHELLRAGVDDIAYRIKGPETDLLLASLERQRGLGNPFRAGLAALELAQRMAQVSSVGRRLDAQRGAFMALKVAFRAATELRSIELLNACMAVLDQLDLIADKKTVRLTRESRQLRVEAITRGISSSSRLSEGDAHFWASSVRKWEELSTFGFEATIEDADIFENNPAFGTPTYNSLLIPVLAGEDLKKSEEGLRDHSKRLGDYAGQAEWIFTARHGVATALEKAGKYDNALLELEDTAKLMLKVYPAPLARYGENLQRQAAILRRLGKHGEADAIEQNMRRLIRK